MSEKFEGMIPPERHEKEQKPYKVIEVAPENVESSLGDIESGLSDKYQIRVERYTEMMGLSSSERDRDCFKIWNGAKRIKFVVTPENKGLLGDLDERIRELERKSVEMQERNRPNDTIELGYNISARLPHPEAANLQNILIGSDKSSEAFLAAREDALPEKGSWQWAKFFGDNYTDDSFERLQPVGKDTETGLNVYGVELKGDENSFPVEYQSPKDYSRLDCGGSGEEDVEIKGYLTLTEIERVRDRGYDVSKLGLDIPKDIGALRKELQEKTKSIQEFHREIIERLESDAELSREDRIQMLRGLEERLHSVQHVPDNNWLLFKLYETAEKIVSDQVEVADEVPENAEQLGHSVDEYYYRAAAFSKLGLIETPSFEGDPTFYENWDELHRDQKIFVLDENSGEERVAKIAAFLLGGNKIVPYEDYDEESGRYYGSGHNIFRVAEKR